MASWFRKPKFTKLAPPAMRGRIPEGLWLKCPKCLESIVKKEWEEDYQVCPKCGHHERLPAHLRIGQLLDPESFVEFDGGLISGDPLQFSDSRPYAQRLEETRERTALQEAVVCGVGRIEGHPVSIGVMDMSFIGGSMGTAVGEKIARTFERGTAEAIPVVLVCCSGGARMQEGILSLMQMAKACAALSRLSQARLPFISILTDPTTGGVTASFALLGDVVIAEPNALIGFAGQRVIEATIRQILPPGFQRAEFLTEHGFVDMVCHRRELKSTVARLISLLVFSRQSTGENSAADEQTDASARGRESAEELILEEAPSAV